MNPSIISDKYNNVVLVKYQIYNSIFMTLPFDKVNRTGVLLPLFHNYCKSGFEEKKNPTEIVENFFNSFLKTYSTEERNGLLFQFIQYIERQVVLIDAIEDAAFADLNNLEGVGTLKNIYENSIKKNKIEELKEFLKFFKTRIVLTAHPTQFYPGPVLGIINDLTKAIQKNDFSTIQQLLAQLGNTPFFKHEKPSPYDEAISLIWYLENVFYQSFSTSYNFMASTIYKNELPKNEIISIGFWPGGDRDGNPFVTTEITLNVAKQLKKSILKNYYKDIKKLKRYLTFKEVDKEIQKLESILKANIFDESFSTMMPLEKFLNKLNSIKHTLISKHYSLYIDKVDDLINKVKLFGYHFATLDIRQDSRVHHEVFLNIVNDLSNDELVKFPTNYNKLSESEQIKILSSINGNIEISQFKDEIVVKTLSSIKAIKTIQENNGELGANRYIISNNQTALNVMETFAMFNLCGFKEELNVDIVPLFETINDLKNAQKTMETLYSTKAYREHLTKRADKQTIMLGFSDGTKDGGYLMANWAIYNAKENLTTISRKYGIKVIFFDGRGGPPARGGGKAHQFYASLGPTIENNEIQLTIQGQTISSKYGNLKSAQYNIEQLLSAGISNELFAADSVQMSKNDIETMDTLSEISYLAYTEFKNHPKFIPYLEQMSTLKYYAETNIGSRPSKRSNSNQLVFSDLRAIPFVGSWSQLKQNVPGFFGVGSALKKYDEKGEFDKVIQLYRNSDFFKALIKNSMMSLTKSMFELTEYMAQDKEFGSFWKLIHDEYNTSKQLILKLTGYTELMQNNQEGKASIKAREEIVLPLLTIQQFALSNIRAMQLNKTKDEKLLRIYEKMVTRSLFGNINASRNSA